MRARTRMFNQFMKAIKPLEKDEVLDVGATPDTMLKDSNLFDKLYPYKKHLTVCSIEDCSELVQKMELKKFVFNEPKKPLPICG